MECAIAVEEQRRNASGFQTRHNCEIHYCREAALDCLVKQELCDILHSLVIIIQVVCNTGLTVLTPALVHLDLPWPNSTGDNGNRCFFVFVFLFCFLLLDLGLAGKGFLK